MTAEGLEWQNDWRFPEALQAREGGTQEQEGLWDVLMCTGWRPGESQGGQPTLAMAGVWRVPVLAIGPLAGGRPPPLTAPVPLPRHCEVWPLSHNHRGMNVDLASEIFRF